MTIKKALSLQQYFIVLSFGLIYHIDKTRIFNLQMIQPCWILKMIISIPKIFISFAKTVSFNSSIFH
jgi:hypothetical protein